MDPRANRARQRPAMASSEIAPIPSPEPAAAVVVAQPRRGTSWIWIPFSLAALIAIGAGSYFAYQHFALQKGARRRKLGKKAKKKKAGQDDDSEIAKPKAPSSSAAANVPSSPAQAFDDAKIDQLSWWSEIAKDQFEAKSLKQAKYYAALALKEGENYPEWKHTITYATIKYISVFGSNGPDKTEILLDVKKLLDNIPMDPNNQREYLSLKGRILSTLSDNYLKSKEWEKAETVCEDCCRVFEQSFADQPDNLHSNMAIQKYQLCVIKKSLKKYDEALKWGEEAYFHATSSKLRGAFSSAVARQRADVLAAVGRYDEAKGVMYSHLKRLEGTMPAPTPTNDEEDEPSASVDDPTAIANNKADNMMFLARMCYEHSEYDEAVTLLNDAFKLNPSPYYLSLLATVLFEAGRTEEAVETQTKIKSLKGLKEMPISSSKYLLTRHFFIRQLSEAAKSWSYSIEVENKPDAPYSSTHMLKKGHVLECRIRKHTDNNQIIDNPVTHTLQTYTVTGQENDNLIKFKGKLTGIDTDFVYEIVIMIYEDESKANLLGTHRQLAKPIHASKMLSELGNPHQAFMGLEDFEADDEETIDLSSPSNVASTSTGSPVTSAAPKVEEESDADVIKADEEAEIQAAPVAQAVQEAIVEEAQEAENQEEAVIEEVQEKVEEPAVAAVEEPVVAAVVEPVVAAVEEPVVAAVEEAVVAAVEQLAEKEEEQEGEEVEEIKAE